MIWMMGVIFAVGFNHYKFTPNRYMVGIIQQRCIFFLFENLLNQVLCYMIVNLEAM